MERTEAELIAAVLKGDAASFEPLVQKYSPRVFATARRYARRESEVEDIAQEVWLKAFDKLKSFRGEAPFEHWLMRMTVRTCYDFLRGHQRNRESAFSDLSEPESDWLERFVTAAGDRLPKMPTRRNCWSPACWNGFRRRRGWSSRCWKLRTARSRKLPALTGWSVPLVKVRAFRARAEMRKILAKMTQRTSICNPIAASTRLKNQVCYESRLNCKEN